MNVGLLYFIIGVVTVFSTAKTMCRDSTEYEKDGLCCSKCKPGSRFVKHCTSEKDTECVECPAGMYSDSMNYYPNCFFCKKCTDDSMQYAKQCSSDSNAVCECKPGYFCNDLDGSVCNLCEKHRVCGPGKGAKSPATNISDVKCAPCPDGTFSNEVSSQPCQKHTRCELQGRSVEKPGNATADTVCGPIVITITSPDETRSSTTEPSTKALTLTPQSTPPNTTAVFVTSRLDYNLSVRLWIGLGVTVLLTVLLIAAAAFCIHHRKAPIKPPVHNAVEAGQCPSVAPDSSPTEKQGLLSDNSSTDPSTSSSFDSHSQGTGVSQDCLHIEQPSVSSPVLNVSITATFNCQVNPAMGSCSIPISPCVLPAEPELPLSQEEELCVPCEQEDSKDAIQSVQESGMTKY
ncbi:tumor necrosis factor receptor superfamily member 1B [Clarias gariepinus]|uniref:tumor necrosis factor receptor superfamily member 1B n=1 Tax=Clarias gariepinus TaxID=13013 RepID=UPI00234D445D|nr:tumor necrosis factor receptor superfamily member 1B [Clarias gariepinus]